MQSYISAKEFAEKWNISQRRVAVLCSGNRINGAMMVGNMWIIPADAEKPADLRFAGNDETDINCPHPFVKWVGGKSQLVGELLKLVPDGKSGRYTKYIEPMVGGGAFLFKLLSVKRFEEYHISDTNRELINTYRVIKNRVDLLTELLYDMQKNYLSKNDDERKKIYYNARDRFNSIKSDNDSEIERAAYFIFLNKTCFNGIFRVNKKGLFNVPVGAYKSPLICDEINLKNVSKALQSVTIDCFDYAETKKYVDENTFVYIDPPYRPLSPTSNFTSYNAETFDDGEQVRLSEYINDINKAGAKFVLSNSDPKNTDPSDDFFDRLYCNYNIKRVDAARMVNCKAEGRGKIKELLIYN